MANINCILHDDAHASMRVYGDFAYCFVCCVSIPVSELNLPARVDTKREITNIKEELEYIEALPTETIRGLQMHCDHAGYYIIWPNKPFYKKRMYSGKNRYIGPSGHKVPLYICHGDSRHLVVVEGELNAASIDKLVWDPTAAGLQA